MRCDVGGTTDVLACPYLMYAAVGVRLAAEYHLGTALGLYVTSLIAAMTTWTAGCNAGSLPCTLGRCAG